jgi:hypothetical protein
MQSVIRDCERKSVDRGGGAVVYFSHDRVWNSSKGLKDVWEIRDQNYINRLPVCLEFAAPLQPLVLSGKISVSLIPRSLRSLRFRKRSFNY